MYNKKGPTSKASFEKSKLDKRQDKKKGIKEGSKKDNKLDSLLSKNKAFTKGKK